MEIKTKADLLQALVNKRQEIELLVESLKKAKDDYARFEELIINDDDLFKKVELGIVVSSNHYAVTWDEATAKLVIYSGFFAWEESALLNEDQLAMLGGEDE